MDTDYSACYLLLKILAQASRFYPQHLARWPGRYVAESRFSCQASIKISLKVQMSDGNLTCKVQMLQASTSGMVLSAGDWVRLGVGTAICLS